MSNRVAQRSLQQKVSIALLAVMGALAVLSFVVLNEVVSPAFDELELSEAQTNLNRAGKAMANDLENLSALRGFESGSSNACQPGSCHAGGVRRRRKPDLGSG
jgi:hypothetical protein